jgi:glyoxylase-like metal-dependent hydrolase (beta-lactamase superfamily II)
MAMVKRLVVGALAAVVLLLLVLAGGLVSAHLAMRREHARLPAAEQIRAGADAPDGPLRVAVINTASQPMPRSAVLAQAEDPRPSEPYIMSHPSFVVEWPDGRLLLVDLGMNHDQALAFGRPIQRLTGGAPIVPLNSVTQRLGAALKRVQGIVFTHLHADHVGGITDLCGELHRTVPVYMTEAQADRPNFTTRAGLRRVRESGCARIEPLRGEGLRPVPGFPGVFVIAAGGHTPGTQIVVAYVGSGSDRRPYAFVGDVANNADGITYDLPKPFLYSLLVVPEDRPRLQELRRYLRELRDRYGVTLLVSHDQRQLDASGLPEWTS